MIGVQEEAKYICQVENCGKLYMEKKQYEIHQRHHKTYVPSTGRYFKCQQCDSKFNSQANLGIVYLIILIYFLIIYFFEIIYV